MTVDEFNEVRGSLPCLYCGSVALDTRRKPPNNIELFCTACNGYQCFLRQGAKPKSRPPDGLSIEEVWVGSNGHCAHCGLDEVTLEILGLFRTKQHVPPFAINGHEGYVIPLCNWCQQHSASEMKRLTSLIDRLSKKFKM